MEKNKKVLLWVAIPLILVLHNYFYITLLIGGVTVITWEYLTRKNEKLQKTSKEWTNKTKPLNTTSD